MDFVHPQYEWSKGTRKAQNAMKPAVSSMEAAILLAVLGPVAIHTLTSGMCSTVILHSSLRVGSLERKAASNVHPWC